MVSSEQESQNNWASGSLWDMTGRKQVITFIGAGGKTTCLQAITREIVAARQRVIATTTTKVFPEQHIEGWKNSFPPPPSLADACFWYNRVEDESGKWIGPPVQVVDKAIASTSPRTVPELHWVIEGDGARGRKLKCWGPHEPQIPERTECAVLVLDRSLWGNVLLTDQVHRWESCQNLLGQVWNAEMAWNYFLSSPVFAPQYEHMTWVILLNSPRKNAEDEGLILRNLSHRCEEIRQDINDLKSKPRHLRLSTGDAKEGELRWFDLW